MDNTEKFRAIVDKEPFVRKHDKLASFANKWNMGYKTIEGYYYGQRELSKTKLACFQKFESDQGLDDFINTIMES